MTTTQGQYAILGAGAIGGYYGACLQKSGCDVHFLLHSDFEQVQQHGLKIDSVNGDFVLPQVKGYQHVQDMPVVDAVIIGLKTTQNARLLPTLLPPLLHPDTVIVTLQNGLDIEAKIAAIAPHHTILGGLCFICSNKIGPGHIHHLDYGSILFGVYQPDRQPGNITLGLERIVAAFTQAGIQVEVTADLYMARWRKLAWNIPYNSLSAILNATTTEIMEHPNARQLVTDLMTEVVAAANACGQKLTPGSDRGLPPGLIAVMLDHTAKMKPYHTSMKIDYDEGRPLEVEAIVGNPLRAARWAGLAVPRLEMLYHQLKALDSKNSDR